MLSAYWTLGVFLVLSGAFASAALVMSWLLQPKSPNDIKNSTYECGMNLLGSSDVQFDIKYYMYGLMFIIFDVEAVFLFPWAVKYKSLGLYGFIEAVIFILILILGLIYVCKKDALTWK
ncbi:MAG: NADH-quinone oxidoreductase subunit A [bacterium]